MFGFHVSPRKSMCAENSQDLINRLSKLPLIQHSGTDYFYGTNTTVLGLVAERAAGRSLAQLLTERVTDPMQIKGCGTIYQQEKTMLPLILRKRFVNPRGATK